MQKRFAIIGRECFSLGRHRVITIDARDIVIQRVFMAREKNRLLFTNNIIISIQRHFWRAEELCRKEKHARRHSMSQGFEIVARCELTRLGANKKNQLRLPLYTFSRCLLSTLIMLRSLRADFKIVRLR